MLHRLAPPHDPARERDAIIIAHIVVLIHTRRERNYLAAADAHQQLKRLGVLIRFLRRPKGGDHE